MGKPEDALELRIEAEELFRKAGNSIMAEEVLAWMNIEAIPTLKKIEKPQSAPVEKIEIEPRPHRRQNHRPLHHQSSLKQSQLN